MWVGVRAPLGTVMVACRAQVNGEGPGVYEARVGRRAGSSGLRPGA